MMDMVNIFYFLSLSGLLIYLIRDLRWALG